MLKMEDAEESEEKLQLQASMRHPAGGPDVGLWLEQAMPVETSSAQAEQDRKDSAYFRKAKDRVLWHCKQMAKKKTLRRNKQKYWAADWASLSDDMKAARTKDFRLHPQKRHTAAMQKANMRRSTGTPACDRPPTSHQHGETRRHLFLKTP